MTSFNQYLNRIKSLFNSKKEVDYTLENEPIVSNNADLKAIVVSDIGNIRTNNEDVGYFVRPNDLEVRNTKGFLAIVADGMGGHAAGEIASKLAVETIRKEYYKYNGDILKSLKYAFNLANKKIYNESIANPKLKGMGTTATAVIVCNKKIYFSHVGDSRFYLLTKEGIQKQTIDHTYVQYLVDKGEISKETALKHPERNILGRAIGTKPEVQVDTVDLNLEFNHNDRLLLCSDGLYDYLSDKEIYELGFKGELKPCAYSLIDLAKNRGGHDNITVIIIEAQDGSLINSEANKKTVNLEDFN